MGVLVGKKAPSFKAAAVVNGGEIVSDFSLDQALIITGDISRANTSIELYPNPVTDWVVISLCEGEGKKEVVIYQMTGKLLSSQQVSGKEAQFYIADYPQGIYVAKILEGGKSKMIKFIKN
jgi:hypothetical protein